MKKVIFSLLLSIVSILGFGQVYTVTISGTVTEEESGNPVANQLVHIWTNDSLPGGSYQSDVYTDVNGFYVDTMNVTDGFSGLVYANTLSCNGYVTQSASYGPLNTSVVMDFEICTDEDCEANFWYYYDNDDILTIHFMDVSQGNPDSWSWDFGDGIFSSAQNPVHTYAQQGEYLVTLSISGGSDSSCFSSIEQYIVVGDSIPPENCQALFSAHIEDGDSINPLRYGFIDMSVGVNGLPPENWFWDFGDSTFSTEQNPVHTFAQEGTYNVCLTISDSAGTCEDTYCQILFVGDSAGFDCNSWFEYEIDEGNSLLVNFEAYTSSQFSTVFSWDFGDGNSGNGQTVSHNYAQSGLYEVVLNTEDSIGCASSDSQWIWVGDSSYFTLSGQVFVADSMPADDATVYCLSYDTISGALVTLGQTQLLSDNGYYEISGVAYSNTILFIQAELNQASAYYGNYVPTYHRNAVNWEDANPVLLPVLPGSYYIIGLQPSLTLPSGNGTISGIINGNLTRGILANVEVLLLDDNGNVLAYTRSDANGHFSFDNLAYGNYIIYTEIVGIETVPGQVTLSENNSSVNVTVTVANGEATLGMKENGYYVKSIGKIYPNPVTSGSNINVTLNKATGLEVSVINQFGQVLSSKNYKLTEGAHRLRLDAANLPVGIYFLKIVPDDKVTITRKFVKTR